MHTLHNSPLSSLPPYSWNCFNGLIFFIYIHEYIIFPLYSPSYAFSLYSLPSHWCQFPRQNLFYLPIGTSPCPLYWTLQVIQRGFKVSRSMCAHYVQTHAILYKALENPLTLASIGVLEPILQIPKNY
jgi:hypothetical protein